MGISVFVSYWLRRNYKPIIFLVLKLKGTHRDHENMIIITGVPYKRIISYDLAKDWGMKISSL